VNAENSKMAWLSIIKLNRRILDYAFLNIGYGDQNFIFIHKTHLTVGIYLQELIDAANNETIIKVVKE
jgi:hypothetical protein